MTENIMRTGLSANNWYIKILTWLRGFRVKISNFPRLHCLAIPRRNLRTKKTKPNIENLPESLGVVLEFQYIERGYWPTKRLLYFVLWKVWTQESFDSEVDHHALQGIRTKSVLRTKELKSNNDCDDYENVP